MSKKNNFILAIVLFLCIINISNSKEYRCEVKEVLVTAYCPCEKCCGSHSDGRTATNTDAYERGVAVDPSFIPLGSRLDIPGYGVWLKADDVGGAIKGDHIDIRFKRHKDAVKWGRKRLKIRIWYMEGNND